MHVGQSACVQAGTRGKIQKQIAQSQSRSAFYLTLYARANEALLDCSTQSHVLSKVVETMSSNTNIKQSHSRHSQALQGDNQLLKVADIVLRRAVLPFCPSVLAGYIQ